MASKSILLIASIIIALSSCMTIRPIPTQAVILIEDFEGLRTKAYRDANGIWTIGYGDAQNVKPGSTISKEEAEEELKAFLQTIGPEITKLVRVPLNNNQYAALLSFVYNIGIGNFEKSDLLREINLRNEDKIIPEFLVWCKDEKGQVLPGLKARRFAEASMYFDR